MRISLTGLLLVGLSSFSELHSLKKSSGMRTMI